MVDYLIYKSNETEVDLNKVKQFESHGDFNKIGVQILQEIGTLVITISAIVRKDNTGKIVPFNKGGWALTKPVQSGHLPDAKAISPQVMMQLQANHVCH